MSNDIENPAICSKCAHPCCRIPGCVHPDDLGEDVVGFSRALLAWRYDIYTRAWGRVMRPRMIEGKCAFLTPTGCELPLARRPRQCRTSIPKERPEKCVFPEKDVEYAEAWRPYIEAILAKEKPKDAMR